METDYKRVKNGAELISAFGEWPSFHDAEVISLTLGRSGCTLDLVIYVFRTGKELDREGQFKRTDEFLVSMRFHAISELRLSDFNEQNVLSGLSLIEEINGTRVLLHGLYGLGADFLCDGAEVCRVTEKGTEREQGHP